MSTTHQMFDGKIKLYKRPRSSHWQCSTYLDGRNRRASTKQEKIALAKEFAEEWYFDLRGKKATGGLVVGKTFTQAAKRFSEEYEVMTEGE